MTDPDTTVADGAMDGDYAAWGRPRWQWRSLEAFATAPELADGIHTIALPQGGLDLLLHGSPLRQGGQRVLPVIFSGAVTNRQAKRPPFFSGLGLAARLGVPVVSIADPSLSLDPALGLGWYSGSQQQPLQPVLAAVLAELVRRSQQELLLVGGSGGGFAAMYYAHMLGDRASALVWNPQTDWLEYEETAVRRYMAAAFPDIPVPAEAGPEFRKAAAAGLDAIGVAHALPRLDKAKKHYPRRLVYLQNASDWHVLRHAGPFMDTVGFVDVGDGFFQSREPEGLMWFGNWGRGHAPPPDALIDCVLRRLLDGEAFPDGLKQSFAQELGRYVDAKHAPRDLRDGAAGQELQAHAVSTGVTLQVTARLDELQPGEAGVTYAFYIHSGDQRIATRWYEPGQSFFHAEIEGQPATQVVAFARDGFGHQVAVKQAPVVPGAVETPVPHESRPASPLRVQIYGSCVSRDAFELAEHGLVLAGYIARSSFASAFDPKRPPSRVVEASSNIQSSFQRRMVEWDIGRRAAELLRDSDCDGILLDLIDERFALLDSGSGLVTVSPEFVRSGYTIDPERLIPSGSAQHLANWKAGMKIFLDATAGRPVIVNRVYWASKDSEGAMLPDQDRIARSNSALDTMYQYLAEQPQVLFIEYPPGLLVADRQHKWGVSPFHYVGEMYDHTMAELTRLLAVQQASRQRSVVG